MKPLRLSLIAAFLIAVLGAAGCCSVDVATDGARKIASVQNNGWFLFGFIPIVSGDPEYANQEVSLWFCDSLTLEVNQMILDEAARKAGARGYRNLTSYTDSESSLLFLFKHKTFHTSAEFVY